MLHVAVCGVFAVLKVDSANSNLQNKLFFFFFFAPYCWQHYVAASYFIFHIKSNTMGNITNWIYIKETFTD